MSDFTYYLRLPPVPCLIKNWPLFYKRRMTYTFCILGCMSCIECTKNKLNRLKGPYKTFVLKPRSITVDGMVPN